MHCNAAISDENTSISDEYLAILVPLPRIPLKTCGLVLISDICSIAGTSIKHHIVAHDLRHDENTVIYNIFGIIQRQDKAHRHCMRK